ncbi:hypothetical protein MSG28_001597 [Choristoneura fumiferana]|uniref:Uncharacterized protein n=1 Tax=Choristoneura fumiferana TaxID=7141 RepID=A0ACC0KV96_CHOFU|nr:hypothetical protein MSG28_001597 [Choristoneura fumiferana]
MADDDDEGTGGMYEDGHWAWDEVFCMFCFSDLPPVAVETIQMPTKAPTGAIEFRDDVDLIEQDAKDIAIYTAPLSILSPTLINLLHLPTTERFIKALIFCCQYYLQVADEMANRILEQETKVRTPFCDILETEFRTNLNDLRVLVAKEYCTMLIGM